MCVCPCELTVLSLPLSCVMALFMKWHQQLQAGDKGGDSAAKPACHAVACSHVFLMALKRLILCDVCVLVELGGWSAGME